MKENFIILLDGMTGAGKSTVSKLLANKMPRTAIVGMDKIKRFVSDFERGERDNTIARDIVFEMTKKYLELGLSVIVEQPFKNEEITKYEELAKNYKVKLFKFQLLATPEIALERLKNRTRELNSDLMEERMLRNISLFKDRADTGFTAIDTSTLEPGQVVKIITSNL